MKSGFKIKTVVVTVVRQRRGGEREVRYRTHQLTGWLNGVRIRKQFDDRAEAEGEKARLEVAAANAGGEIRARNTRLTADQVVEAEAAFARLSGKSLTAAVEWFLKTYRPPVTRMTLAAAETAFLADRKPHIRKAAYADYGRTLRDFREAHPARAVHEIATSDVQAFLAARNVGKKRFNNLRGDLHAFFEFCHAAPRQWTEANPVKPIKAFRISRGVPAVISAETAAKLMAFVETYAGPERSKLAPGCLVPYFALCLFAGLRPAVPNGEVWKLGQRADASTLVDLDLGVIRILPEVSKTNEFRTVKIRPNLAAWLARYPIKKYTLIPRNAQAMITDIRKRFELGDDVLRHTFLSMHVAKWKSVGEAALEAGNSERMTKKHYLHMRSEAEADAFWGIVPVPQQMGEVIPIAG